MRVGVAVKGHGGKIYASATMDVNVPVGECLSYIVEPAEVVGHGRVEEARAAEEVAEAPEDAAEMAIMQEGADQEIELATQRLEEEDDVPPEHGQALTLEAAQQYQRLWQEGWITDDMVAWRRGDQVLHQFCQAREDARVRGPTQETEEEAMLKAVLAAEDFAGDSQRMDEASEAATEEFPAPEVEAPAEGFRGQVPGAVSAGGSGEQVHSAGAAEASADGPTGQAPSVVTAEGSEGQGCSGKEHVPGAGAAEGSEEHVQDGGVAAESAEGFPGHAPDAVSAEGFPGQVCGGGAAEGSAEGLPGQDPGAVAAEGSPGQVCNGEDRQMDNCCGHTLYDSRERWSHDTVYAEPGNANCHAREDGCSGC